jgi:hypothetical protein
LCTRQSSAVALHTHNPRMILADRLEQQMTAGGRGLVQCSYGVLSRAISDSVTIIFSAKSSLTGNAAI